MIIIMLIIAAVIATVDQLIKIWAVQSLAGTGISKQFIHIGDTEIVNLTYTENTGAAFSIMSGQKWFTIGFAAVVMIAFFIYMTKNYKDSKPAMIFTALIVGGGIGNLIDRIRIGYVVDYIEVRIFRFAIFNFADICVTIGVALMLIYFLFFYGRKNNLEIEAKINE